MCFKTPRENWDLMNLPYSFAYSFSDGMSKNWRQMQWKFWLDHLVALANGNGELTLIHKDNLVMENPPGKTPAQSLRWFSQRNQGFPFNGHLSISFVFALVAPSVSLLMPPNVPLVTHLVIRNNCHRYSLGTSQLETDEASISGWPPKGHTAQGSLAPQWLCAKVVNGQWPEMMASPALRSHKHGACYTGGNRDVD